MAFFNETEEKRGNDGYDLTCPSGVTSCSSTNPRILCEVQEHAGIFSINEVPCDIRMRGRSEKGLVNAALYNIKG